MEVDPTNNDVFHTKTSIHMASAHEYIPPKRFRAGSVSGRLRTASDLEEIGYIDKQQKGVLKDLIISGDQQLLIALDKYEKGDTDVLAELIRKGFLQRKNSIDILDSLDFDFLNVVNQTKRDRFNSLDDTLGFSNVFSESSAEGDLNYLDILRPQRSGSMSNPSFPTHVFSEEFDSDRMPGQRHSSVDSTQSFKIFDFLTTSGFDEAYDRKIETSHPFESSTLPSSNRVVREFSRKDQNHIDMSAYTAVARTLAQTPAPKTGLTISIRNPKITPSPSSYGTITTKEKPMPSMINPQFMLSLSSSSGGVPTASKHSENPDNKGAVGAYTAEQRKKRIDKFLEKRSRRVWTKKVKYDVRKNFADSRLRVKGRFVKKEEEHFMRELLDI